MTSPGCHIVFTLVDIKQLDEQQSGASFQRKAAIFRQQKILRGGGKIGRLCRERPVSQKTPLVINGVVRVIDLEMNPVVREFPARRTISVMKCIGEQKNKLIFFHIKI